MNKIQAAQSGTVIVNGIEYNEHPFPSSLIKATEMKWALKLRDEGCIRLNSVEFYQALENPELGDRNEAKGTLKVDGHSMEVGSGNEVFLWCSAIPEASPEILKRLDASYDAIVRIHDVEKFVKRIVSTAKLAGYILYPHLGKVNYNRGEEVSKDVLNKQRWHYNVFQKSSGYAHQMEYRLSFSNFTFQRIDKKHLDLSLGKCNDIIMIET
jgi:hypothetical protein